MFAQATTGLPSEHAAPADRHRVDPPVRDGEVHANDVMLAAADTLLNDLAATADVLSRRRAAAPAAS
jgi:hypothetical protein